MSYWAGDGKRGKALIKINLGQQKAYFYKGSELVGVSRISTGKEGHDTPPGRYKVTEKSKNHRSSLYGVFKEEGTGRVVNDDVDTRKDKVPPGCYYEGAPMWNFLRFNGGVGMHTGYLPRLQRLTRLRADARQDGTQVLRQRQGRHPGHRRVMPDLPDPAYGMELDVEQVAAFADDISSGSIRLIDCREQDEWDFNHLPDAAFLPLSRFTEIAGSLVSGDEPVIIYCHHGMRSLHATQWLRSRGQEQSWSMRGGIQAWSEKVDPSVPRY